MNDLTKRVLYIYKNNVAVKRDKKKVQTFFKSTSTSKRVTGADAAVRGNFTAEIKATAVASVAAGSSRADVAKHFGCSVKSLGH